MGLLAGIAAVVATWVVVALFSSLFPGFEVYWVGAAAWACWAALDSRRNDWRRFERVFPLDPLPLFLAVLLAWPFALPWYMRLRRKAQHGELAEGVPAKRVRYVVLGVVAVGALVSVGAALAFSRTDTWKDLMQVTRAVQAETRDPASVSMRTGGTRAVTIQVWNSRIPAGEAAEREAEARRLAVVAVRALPDSHRVASVGVKFTKQWGSAGLTYTKDESSYSWAANELVR